MNVFRNIMGLLSLQFSTVRRLLQAIIGLPSKISGYFSERITLTLTFTSASILIPFIDAST